MYAEWCREGCRKFIAFTAHLKTGRNCGSPKTKPVIDQAHRRHNPNWCTDDGCGPCVVVASCGAYCVVFKARTKKQAQRPQKVPFARLPLPLEGIIHRASLKHKLLG